MRPARSSFYTITVNHKWQKSAIVVNLPRSGWPTKITPKSQRRLIQEVTKDPTTTFKELQASLASVKQNNEPKHASKSTSDWLKKNKVKTLEWPSQSPDMNPIEMLWYDLKKAVHAGKPSNVAVRTHHTDADNCGLSLTVHAIPMLLSADFAPSVSVYTALCVCITYTYTC
ncbi:hypothetical protein NFI96_000893 [Prochilodus magdalenae]|nr:hypothetical protein NFI96_000893 [Prochilodus magdalenae]